MSGNVIVIGSGPGGYKSALYAAERGFDVKLIEKSSEIGGVCTNRGCIPSKALLSIADLIDQISGSRRKGITANLEEIDFKKCISFKNRAVRTSRKGIMDQLDKNDIDLIRGKAKIINENVVEVDGDRYEANYIVIATGSEPIELPGITIDEKDVLTSKGALELDEIPESMVVIGGGYVGLELAFVFSLLGSKITIVELMDSILPNMDKDIAEEMGKILKRKRINVITGSKVSEVKKKEKEDIYEVKIEGDTKETIKTEKVLCSVGRKPTPPETDIDIIGDHGEIVTNDYMKTAIDNMLSAMSMVSRC